MFRTDAGYQKCRGTGLDSDKNNVWTPERIEKLRAAYLVKTAGLFKRYQKLQEMLGKYRKFGVG